MEINVNRRVLRLVLVAKKYFEKRQTSKKKEKKTICTIHDRRKI